MLSDGKMRTVHYSIIEDGGFAGFGQGVEWCVVGLDRNWAYSPGCRAATALISFESGEAAADLVGCDSPKFCS